MSFRFDMRNKTPQQKIIVSRRNEENERLKNESEIRTNRKCDDRQTTNKLVESSDEIIENIRAIDMYLSGSDIQQREYAKLLIKKGTCFLVINKNGSYKFYPSRFIGYAMNTQKVHESNENKDGRITNAVISKIVASEPKPDQNLENEYYKYCSKLGFEANRSGNFGAPRKYWIF